MARLTEPEETPAEPEPEAVVAAAPSSGQVVVVANVKTSATTTDAAGSRVIELPIGAPVVVDYTDEIKAQADAGLVTVQHG